MATTLVNRHHKEPWDEYIGRGSLFGNKWGHNAKHVEPEFLVKDRAEAIAKFKEGFLRRCESDFDFKLNVLKLKGKTLCCSCKPMPCHGDPIVEYIENYEFMPDNDGIDHVNIHSKGETPLGVALGSMVKIRIEAEREEILEEIRVELRADKCTLMLLKECSLPLTNYSLDKSKGSDTVRRHPGFEWVVEEFERIRKIIKKK